MPLSHNGYQYDGYNVKGSSVKIMLKGLTDAFSITIDLQRIKDATTQALKLAIITELKAAIDSRVTLLAQISVQESSDATEETNIAGTMSAIGA